MTSLQFFMHRIKIQIGEIGQCFIQVKLVTLQSQWGKMRNKTENTCRKRSNFPIKKENSYELST